jgi:tRNA threonylcarbamoyladenosine biosynthesis protein TsaB
MNILALDTTSKFSSLSILRDKDIVLEYNFATRDELSATLISAIEFVLKSVAIELDQIDAYGISVGPGLFTGIRVGLANLKGLNHENRKPVVPVTSLEALAFKYNESKIPVVAIIDARRKEVYVSAFSFDQGIQSPLDSPQLIHIDQLIDYLSPLGKCLLVGNGAEVHKSLINTHLPQNKILHRSYFLASEIGTITANKMAANDYVSDLQELMPLYIRKPDAEQNLRIAEAKKNNSQHSNG